MYNILESASAWWLFSESASAKTLGSVNQRLQQQKIAKYDIETYIPNRERYKTGVGLYKCTSKYGDQECQVRG